MKVYTIAAIFGLADNDDYDQLWVAHYKNKKDAIDAFRFKLKETGGLNENGTVTVEDNDKYVEWNVDKLFDDMLANGCHHQPENSAESNRWFIRHEDVQTFLDTDRISWE